MPTDPPEAAPVFFASAADFGAWLAEHAGSVAELAVGFHKVGSGQDGMSWPESVDEALCVGWIDGVRRRIDAQRYWIRFTPRKPRSTWSAVNIERVAALAQQGRMQPAGLAAFARRSEARSRTYAYEQASVDSAGTEARLRQHPLAWSFFAAQAPSYRKKLLWWVASAKQASTREARLGRLIEALGKGQRL